MTSLLVTAGAGYIGSHTCKALRQAGFAPVTYDNLERGNREAVRWGELEIGDIADGARLWEVSQDIVALPAFILPPGMSADLA